MFPSAVQVTGPKSRKAARLQYCPEAVSWICSPGSTWMEERGEVEPALETVKEVRLSTTWIWAKPSA